MIRKGDVVFMLRPSRERHARIIKGTPGEVMAYRSENQTVSYLVKFAGHAGFRHCESDEIIGRETPK